MSALSKIGQLSKDAIFPAFCFGCGKEETYLCDGCLNEVGTGGALACPRCHVPTVGGVCCEDCKNKSSVRRQIAVLPFDSETTLGQMIHTWKYGFAEDLQPYFFKIIKKFIEAEPYLFRGIDAIVPVPLHPERFAERGFNQAAVLAEAVGSRLHVPVFKSLERVRYTSQQALLSKEKRQENVHDAFKVCQALSSYARHILLVDDVYTTGSTVQECARTVLKVYPDTRVSGFTLARG